MNKKHAVKHHNTQGQEPAKQAQVYEEQVTPARCQALLGWCAFCDQCWSEAATHFRSALALVVQLKQGAASRGGAFSAGSLVPGTTC